MEIIKFKKRKVGSRTFVDGVAKIYRVDWDEKKGRTLIQKYEREEGEKNLLLNFLYRIRRRHYYEKI